LDHGDLFDPCWFIPLTSSRPSLPSSFPPARAAVIFDDFGPGYTYDQFSGFSSDLAQTTAVQFTANANYRLTKIDLGLTSFIGPSESSPIYVGIYADSAGNIDPNPVVLHNQIANLPFFGQSDNSIATWNNVNVNVEKYHKYWLYLFGIGVWNSNSTSTIGRIYFSPDGYLNNTVLPAFDIIGTTSVPEPSTWAMVLAGFAVLGFAGMRGSLGNMIAAPSIWCATFACTRTRRERTRSCASSWQGG
jgi:hypothetical protein